MRFLFWNTKKNNVDDYILKIIREQRIDVFCAAEYSGNIESLCSELKAYKSFDEIFAPGCDRIKIIGNINDFSVSFQSTYYSMQLFRNDYLLCFLHLPSRIYEDSYFRREAVVTEIMEKVKEFEADSGIDKIVITGDFNINPYEELCLRANKLHSIPYEFEAIRDKRIYCGKDYKMFYNPMWNFLGDQKFPFGTYYLASSDAICPFWNIYDQVLIRPSLLSRFKKNELNIITHCENENLYDEQFHPRKEISDHLPIVFELED